MNIFPRIFKKYAPTTPVVLANSPQDNMYDIDPAFLKRFSKRQVLSDYINQIKDLNVEIKYDEGCSGTLLTYSLRKRQTDDIEDHVYFSEWSLLLIEHNALIMGEYDEHGKTSCLELAIAGDEMFDYKPVASTLLARHTVHWHCKGTWLLMFECLRGDMLAQCTTHAYVGQQMMDEDDKFAKQCIDAWLNNENKSRAEKKAFAKLYDENQEKLPHLKFTKKQKSKYFKLLYAASKHDNKLENVLKRLEAVEKELAELKIRPAVLYGEELNEVKEHYYLLEKENTES